MPSEPRADLALLFDFDGTLYVGDLPILAYARHCSEVLSVAGATALIDNIRFFLEGKLFGDQLVDLTAAQDGYEAVEILAAAAGLTTAQVSAAYRAARMDLAASAFALDAPDGLVGLLQDLPGVHVMVVTNADPTGVGEVLDSIEVSDFIHQVITDAGKPASMPGLIAESLQQIGAAGEPGRMMVVGDRWSTDLVDAHRLGAATALIDRFSRGDGAPTLRAADLAGLVPGIRDWVARCRVAR